MKVALRKGVKSAFKLWPVPTQMPGGGFRCVAAAFVAKRPPQNPQRSAARGRQNENLGALASISLLPPLFRGHWNAHRLCSERRLRDAMAAVDAIVQKAGSKEVKERLAAIDEAAAYVASVGVGTDDAPALIDALVPGLSDNNVKVAQG
eukprot:scaffold103295_cov33-Phaeocystis_antarctica.AAC.1